MSGKSLVIFYRFIKEGSDGRQFATLCVPGNEKKNRVASEVLDLVEKIQKNQPEGSAFLIAHIATMLTNILEDDTKKRIQEMLSMTWIDKVYKEKEDQAVANAVRAKNEEISKIIRENDEKLREKDEEIHKKDELSALSKIIYESTTKSNIFLKLGINSRTNIFLRLKMFGYC